MEYEYVETKDGVGTIYMWADFGTMRVKYIGPENPAEIRLKNHGPPRPPELPSNKCPSCKKTGGLWRDFVKDVYGCSTCGFTVEMPPVCRESVAVIIKDAVGRHGHD